MAKSKSFFGLRQGSTKSLTFQVLRGEQITKDRVTNVTNPQTKAQMQQRLITPMVASARATLKTLVNHSFEGVTYGEPSLKVFSSLNMASGGLTKIVSYVPKGAMDTGLADFIISRGSLTPITVTGNGPQTNKRLYEGIETSLKSANMSEGVTPFNADNSMLTEAFINAFLKANPTIKEGDQITILGCYQGDEYDYTANADNEENIAYYHRYLISRLILDTTTPQTQFTASAVSNNISLTDGYFQIGIGNIGADGIVTVKPIYEPAKNKLLAACCILSRKTDNVWQRSSQRLTILNDSATADPGYSEVIYSYLKSSNAKSTKYLNSGVDGVDITGGSTSA